MFLDHDDYWNHNHVLSDVVDLLSKSQADVLCFKSILFWDGRQRAKR